MTWAGIYEFDGDKLKIHCAQHPDIERPGGFGVTDGGGTVLLVLERKKPDPVAAEKAKLMGEWVIARAVTNGLDDSMYFGISAIGRVATFTDDTFAIAPNMPAVRYVLRPGESPKQIDLPAQNVGDLELGSYELDAPAAGALTMHFAAKGGQGRPTDFKSEKGRGTVLLVLERKKPDPVAAEKAKLKGTWVVTELQGGDGTPASEAEKKQVVGMTATFDGDTFTMRGPARYDLRPGESPKQIDVFAEKPAEAMVGIDELDGDKLKLHFGGVVPKGASARPADFAAKPKGGTTLMVLERVKAAAVAVPPAPVGTATLFGEVTHDGKPVAGGRVTVFVDDTQFVGAKIVAGKFTVAGIPAGKRRVEWELADGDYRNTLVKGAVEFVAGERRAEMIEMTGK